MTTAFNKDGIQVVRGLFNAALLNVELDRHFANPSAWVGWWSWRYLRMNRRELLLNGAALDFNLMELALDVARHFSHSIPGFMESHVLTALTVEEQRREAALQCHTDQRRQMVRAILYVAGGDSINGASQYAPGTQHEEKPKDAHYFGVPLHVYPGRPGDAVLIDTYGYHARTAVGSRRRAVIFEFQPRGTDYPKSHIYFNSSWMTNRVAAHMKMLLSEPSPALHGATQAFWKNAC